MNFRESFLSVLDGKMPSSVPLTEFMMFWTECNTEYFSKMQSQDYNEFFGLGKFLDIPCHFTVLPLFERKVLSETEKHLTIIDEQGITCRIEKNTSAMPQFIDFPIKTREDFLNFKTRLNPLDKRYGDLKNINDEAIKNDAVTKLTSRGPFAFLRDFIKFEDLMYLCVDEPEFIIEMTMFHADFLVNLWSKLLDQITPDIVYIGEDMAYKNGSMLSPDMLKKFVVPAWKKVNGFLHSKGVKNIILDSDGNVNSIIPLAIESGYNIILPIERAAGMDGEVVRKLYPNLTMIGGVDKLNLMKGKKEIDFEVDKAVRLFKQGRYIPSCDHSVPPVVSFENYSYYINQIKTKIGGIL